MNNEIVNKNEEFLLFPSCSLKYLFQSMQSAVRSVFLNRNVKTILCMQKETFPYGKYRKWIQTINERVNFSAI